MWQLETGIAAEGLAKRLNKDMTLFHVIPNTCGIQYFEAARLWSKEENEYVSGKNGVFILLVFTAWYRHKNLEIIPYVADALRKIAPHMKFLFRLTLPKNEMPWKHIRQIANKLGVGECVENIGPQKPIDGPRLYKCSDALFLPTLLEVFSANYPEAMCMRRPIITTDMEFARDICCNAAKYFKPDDPYDAAMAIIDVAKDERLRKELVKNGEQRLLDFGRPESKLARIVEIMELMVDARRTTKGRIPQ